MNQIFSLNQPLNSILWSANNKLIREIILILSGIALLGLSAQCVIPLKPVPLTFQSATVVFIGMIYGARLGSLTILGYLAAGVLGVPVYAQLSSGIHPLFGTTAGYLIGFVPAAMIGGFLAQRGWARSVIGTFVAACLSASVIFVLGVSVLSRFIGWNDAFLFGLAPFVATEPLKLLAISLVIPKFWKAV